MELTTLGGFLRTDRHAVENCFAANDMAFVCGNDGVLTQISKSIVREWFAMSIFRVSCCMHCKQILSLAAISRQAEVDLDATGVQLFIFWHERLELNFLPLVPGATRERAVGTEVAEGAHDEIRPIHREKFADRGISCDFHERTLFFFLEKGHEYTEHSIRAE